MNEIKVMKAFMKENENEVYEKTGVKFENIEFVDDNEINDNIIMFLNSKNKTCVLCQCPADEGWSREILKVKEINIAGENVYVKDASIFNI